MKNTIKLTQIKSSIGSPKSIRSTLLGLGFTRLNQTVTRVDSPEIRGMFRKVQHLVRMEE